MLPAGLALVVSAAAIGIMVQSAADDAPATDTPTERGDARFDTDAERPGDLVVSGWYTTRSSGEVAPMVNTAAPVPGSVSCIPALALGPNVDLAPDPTGQRSSGMEILDDLRQHGPNAGLHRDANGQRSSGIDPVCVAPRSADVLSGQPVADAG